MAAGKHKKMRPQTKGGQTKETPLKRSKAGRDRQGAPPRNEILYGFHSVYEALKAGRRRFDQVMVSDRRTDPRVEKILALAQEKQVSLVQVNPETLDRLSHGGVHQGIAARVSPFPIQPAMDLFPLLERREAPFFILLVEGIEDAHNLGALIRTALCAGVDHILIPKDRSALPSPGVSRTSAGAMEHAPIFEVTNVPSLLRQLQDSGAWVSGLDADGDKTLFEADLTGDLVLVVGGEHRGIRPGVRKACDFILSIPMSDRINSLNASVAGGIAMFEAVRQRSLSS